MAERKDILVAILKALLAGLETSVFVKIPATFIAELAASDKGKVKELGEASGEVFEELLTQMELATTNAAVAAVGNEQIKKLISNFTALTDAKLQSLTKLTQEEFENTNTKLDTIVETTSETNANVKKILALLEPDTPRIEKKDILEILHAMNDGSEGFANAIKRFDEEGDFELAKDLLMSKSLRLQLTEQIEDPESVFIKKEEALQAVIQAGMFYESTSRLDVLIAKSPPTSVDLGEFLQIINNDKDLAVYFYKVNINPAWLDVLNTVGQFKQLGDADITNDFLVRMKAFYLVEVSKTRPADIVDLISELNVKDWFIQGVLLESLLAKPLEVVDSGLALIKVYLNNKTFVQWYGQGERSAKFMTAIAGDHPGKAFEIAEVLLEIYREDEDKYFDKIKSRFKKHDYNRLLFKYFKKLLEYKPYESARLLIDTFNNYLCELTKDDYSLKSGFHSRIERLDQIGDSRNKTILKSVIQAICESGKSVIENQPDKIDGVFSYLEELDQPVFERIKMHLLRFVSAGAQKERIEAIISNKKYFDLIYRYEYRLLLRDKSREVSGKALSVFTDWVAAQNLDADDKDNINSWFNNKEDRDATEEDYKKIENADKARELYLVKDVFKELYDGYQKECGTTDEELAPKPRVSRSRHVDPKENSPLNEDDMVKMEPSAVIEYLLDSSKWVIDKTNQSHFRTPEEAMSHVFEGVVKRRAADYAKLEIDLLLQLRPVFLERYFNGLCNSLSEKFLDESDIVNVLGNSKVIVDANLDSKEHEWTFRLILNVIEAIYENEEVKKNIVPNNKTIIWDVIAALFNYKDEDSPADTDPHQETINSVPGIAFTLIKTFGHFSKNNDEADYLENWSDKIVKKLSFVIDNAMVPRIWSVLGVYFPQIHWMEKAFVEENIDKIFDTNDDDAWKCVWGSYLSWSGVYKNVFVFLAEKNKYSHGISKIETYGETDSFGRGIEGGLVQHLTIAYFNNWIEWEDPLLVEFFDKSPAKWRGRAASFLRTGFRETLKCDPSEKQEKGERIKVYWQERLKVISSNPAGNMDEAIELIGWIEDTLLDPKETLELILQTLELTGGKLGNNRDEVDLVKGACKIGKGNELLALKCMNKMMEGKPEWISLSLYKDDLDSFLDHVVSLSGDTDGIIEIHNEAIELINAYGRRQIDDLKPYYDKFKNVKL